MKNKVNGFYITLFLLLILSACEEGRKESGNDAVAGIKMEQYCLENPPFIGTFEGLDIYEGGISGMAYIPGTNLEFYLINDRGPNLEMTAHPDADGQNIKVFPFPDYAPKIFRAELKDGRFLITETLPLKRPDGQSVTGLPFPGNFKMNREIAWKDLKASLAGEDVWGIDAEGIAIGNDNDFWIVEEYRTSIWHIDASNGKVKKVFGPEMMNEHYQLIDTVFKYRRPNRGFESVAITPSGKIYALLQSPMWYPSPEISGFSRLVRLLELDPQTGETKTFLYEHAPAKTEVRLRDWKLADMVAINDEEFLVLEHASRKGEQYMDLYKINISQASPLTDGLFDGKTAEQLADAEGAAAYNVRTVEKTHFLDLIKAGYDPQLDKPEGIAIIDEQTIAIINDNDYDIDAPFNDANIIKPGHPSCLFLFTLPESMRLDLSVN